MKKLLVTLAAVLVSVSTFAQGTILFNNRTLTAGDIRVYADAGRTTGAGTLGTVNAQLFLVPTGGGAATPLTPATTFRSGAASFFVNPVDVTVSTLPAGTSVNLIMRAWVGDSFDTSLNKGESDPFTLALGGANPTTGQIVPTPDLAGMTPFNLTVIPEPSTIALGLVGAAALLYRRRS